mgnify:CR=1 FL=1
MKKVILRNCPTCRRTDPAPTCAVCNGPPMDATLVPNSVMVRITSPTGTIVEYMEYGLTLDEALDSVSMSQIEVFNPSGRLDRWGMA